MRIEWDGKPVKCPICGNDEFHNYLTLLNTQGMSFLGFDWANREAETFICKVCGHIQRFDAQMNDPYNGEQKMEGGPKLRKISLK